jgi:hypothetical protein
VNDILDDLKSTKLDSTIAMQAAFEIQRLRSVIEEMKLRLPRGMCSIDGCERPAKIRGWCQTHYMRWVRRGHPAIVMPPGKPGSKRKHPLYGTWAGMKNRCENPNNHCYPRYGGNGITVCDRWKADFCNFLADMGERPHGTTLDRKDPYGPYSPDNCRWATPKQQRANRTIEGDRRARVGSSRGAKRTWRRWRFRRAARALA